MMLEMVEIEIEIDKRTVVVVVMIFNEQNLVEMTFLILRVGLLGKTQSQIEIDEIEMH